MIYISLLCLNLYIKWKNNVQYFYNYPNNVILKEINYIVNNDRIVIIVLQSQYFVTI